MAKSKTEAGYETPLTHSKVKVYDDRPELGNQMKLVAQFDKVPSDWNKTKILEFFGIAEHLHVTRSEDRLEEVIQQGRR